MATILYREVDGKIEQEMFEAHRVTTMLSNGWSTTKELKKKPKAKKTTAKKAK